MNLRTYDIFSNIDCEIIRKGENIQINNVCIDNRDVSENDIFFAIKGEKFNANKVALDVLKSGAAMVVIDEIHFDIEDVPEGKTVIKVKNVVKSLGEIARNYKNTLDIKIVAVTGSVGKTSTRDMITSVLSSKYNVFKTKRNFNSDIGLPIMLLSLDDSYDVAVLEMGMDHAGDIEYLVNIVNPDIAVITNIGLSHIQNLGSQEAIFNAKMEIASKFNKNNTLIINGDDEFLSKVSSDVFSVIKVGASFKNNIMYRDVILGEFESECILKIDDFGYKCSLKQPGKHNIINASLAIAVANELGVDILEAIKSLTNIDKTSMRLDIINADNFVLINDCYNASPDSMRAAIDVLSNIEGKRKICVIGSMNELGDESENSHRDIGKYIKGKKNIDLILATGNYTEFYKDELGDMCTTYEDKESLSLDLKSLIKDGDIILVKASRGLKFETISEYLLEN